MRKTSPFSRGVSLFLTALMVFGCFTQLFINDAYAAPPSGVPGTIKMSQYVSASSLGRPSDYYTSPTLTSTSTGTRIYPHYFKFSVGEGDTRIGLCLDHNGQLDGRYVGQTWTHKQEFAPKRNTWSSQGLLWAPYVEMYQEFLYLQQAIDYFWDTSLKAMVQAANPGETPNKTMVTKAMLESLGVTVHLIPGAGQSLYLNQDHLLNLNNVAQIAVWYTQQNKWQASDNVLEYSGSSTGTYKFGINEAGLKNFAKEVYTSFTFYGWPTTEEGALRWVKDVIAIYEAGQYSERTYQAYSPPGSGIQPIMIGPKYTFGDYTAYLELSKKAIEVDSDGTETDKGALSGAEFTVYEADGVTPRKEARRILTES